MRFGLDLNCKRLRKKYSIFARSIGMDRSNLFFFLLVCVREESLATRNRDLYTKASAYANPRARAKSSFASVYYVLGNSFDFP